MIPTRTRRAFTVMQQLCKQSGTPIRLRWNTYPNGTPPLGAVTGSALLADDLVDQDNLDLTDQSGRQLQTQTFTTGNAYCLTCAFTHFVQPTMTAARQYAEIQVGDCILDMVIPLMTVTAIGNTTLTVGQVVDLPTFNAANRALGPGLVMATGTVCDPSSLLNAEVVIYDTVADQQADTDGQVWVQQRLGQDLAQSWESIFDQTVLGQSFLLRKAT